MKNLTVAIFYSLLFALAPPIAVSAANSSLDSTIETYIAAEETQNYVRIYKLFGSTKKNQLRRESKVRDAESYARLRRSAEARWFNFVEKTRREAKDSATIKLAVDIEESGQVEGAIVTIRLLKVAGDWKIEAIDY